MSKNRCQLQDDKERFAKRFYRDWKKYCYEYAATAQNRNVVNYIDVYDNVVLAFRSPQIIKHHGCTSSDNTLIIALVHPRETKGQLVFEVKLELNLSGNGRGAKDISRQHNCTINPALNLHTSVIAAKLLVHVASLINQNRLDSIVSSAILAVTHSMESNELVMPKPLYVWKDKTIT